MVQFTNVRKQKFFNVLPDKFLRKEAMVFCKKCNISQRTAIRYLRELLEKGYLNQSDLERYGEYSKNTNPQ